MIKNRDKKIIDMLSKLAEDVAPVGAAKLASAVVIGGKIVSTGINQNQMHPFQSRFAKDPNYAFWHAETNAIYNALKRVHIQHLKNSTLYVARVKYNNAPQHGGEMVSGIAKPCRHCQRALDWFQIKRVVYTTDDGSIEEMESL